MPSIDEFLNVAFFAIHSSWIACTGWAWRRTRKWHLGATLSIMLYLRDRRGGAVPVRPYRVA